jgi:6-phosphogluconate dehydrogenase
MELGFIGLGKMGANMVLRLIQGSPDGSVRGGHTVIGFAKDPAPELRNVKGLTLVSSLEDLVRLLKPPRVAWVMVPAGDATESVIMQLAERFQPGDLIVDGGNSYYKDSVRRGEGLSKRGIGFLDVGTSGGIWGREEGYCMTAGGLKEHVDRLRPALDTLAPPDGWAHVGPGGAGHFVKMVHNGIEYGLMEAYGEGFEVMSKSPFGINMYAVTKVWNRGSVIRSWLLELAERLFETEASDLRSIRPYVEDSGEGRWTIHAALELDTPVPVIAAALFARFSSRDEINYAARFTAGLRNQFGGHEIKRPEKRKLEKTGEVKPQGEKPE